MAMPTRKSDFTAAARSIQTADVQNFEAKIEQAIAQAIAKGEEIVSVGVSGIRPSVQKDAIAHYQAAGWEPHVVHDQRDGDRLVLE
jgi:siroheme synthase